MPAGSSGGYLSEAPQLAVEILSPGTRGIDLVDKVEEYARAGLHHYWVVDPRDPITVVVFAREGDRLVELVRATGDEELAVTAPFEVRFRPNQLGA